ncbi:MAG: hypothetical protein WC886_06570 [Saccharofermentanaceae bacterium]|jgi:hypothetical protein
MRSQYYISFDAGANWSEFWPSNSPVIKLVKESNEIFKRWSIDKFRIGRTRNVTVYDALAAMYFVSSNFGTDIKYKIKDLGTDRFYFIKPITGGTLNFQDSVYEVNPDPDDLYRPLLHQYQKKWQNLTATKIFGENLSIYYPVLNTALFNNVDFTTFTDVAKSVTWSNTSAGTEQHARCKLDVFTLTDFICTVVISNFAGDTFNLILVDEINNTLSTTVNVTGDGKYELLQTANAAIDVYLEMNKTSPSSVSGSFDYQAYYTASKTSGGLFRDCLDNIINDVAFMNLSYTIKSTILWNDALGTDPPSAISTYITAHSTNDYVIEGAANWNYLWLGRLDSFTTSKEENIEMSLKDLMDILKLKMRLWWFIDEDGYFRIEHEKYFREYTTQTDLTSATYAVDKPEVDQKIYNYALNEAVSQITYGESNQLNADWIAPDVSFPVLSTSENTKEVKISQLTTDLANAINDPSISSSGIILLKCKPMGAFNYLVDLDQSTKDPAVYIVNARLGWHYLINNYFKYFAEAGAGTIDGSAFTYTHVKEYLKQNKIKFRKSTSLLWYKPLTLSKGTGWIEDAEYDVESGMYSVNIGFNPYE